MIYALLIIALVVGGYFLGAATVYLHRLEELDHLKAEKSDAFRAGYEAGFASRPRMHVVKETRQ